jgi:hypothetical protein
MESILNFIQEDIQRSAVLAMFLAFGILWVKKKYKRKNSMGISDVEASVPTSTGIPAGTYETPEQSYSNTLEGQTNGISWTLTSSVMVTQDEAGKQEVSKRHTIWTSADVKLPAGHFIFMQPVPKEYKYKPDPKEGFLGNIVKWAAETAMDGMVAAHFGEQYMSTVNLDGSQTVMAEGIKNYFIRSSLPDIARGFAEGPAGELIRQWRTSLQGFDHEEELDMTHFLMTDDGMHAACMVSMGSEEDARKLANFCAALAAEMRNVSGASA